MKTRAAHTYNNSKHALLLFVLMAVLAAAVAITTVAIAAAVTPRAEAAATEVSEPVYNDGLPTWDCVYFGHYPQNEVGQTLYGNENKKVELKEELKALPEEKWNEKNETVYKKKRYKRIKFEDTVFGSRSNTVGRYNWGYDDEYRYFECEPIKWRVLSDEGGKALLLSDKSLYYLPNHSATNCTWKTSEARSWLNGYDASENTQNKDYSATNFYDNAF